MFPNVIGEPKDGTMEQDEYIGDEALDLLSQLMISYPMERGIVQDWDQLDKIAEYIFANQLQVDPSEHKVLVSEPILNPGSNKENFVELMFEVYDVQGLYIG